MLLQGSVNIPLYVSTRKYDPESKKKRVVRKDKVEDWIKQVRLLRRSDAGVYNCFHLCTNKLQGLVQDVLQPAST
jgi:hypothetical protein